MESYLEHRKRVKERFRKEGLDNFDERYVLELLLFYCVPRKDTKELAIRLLEHFGSIVQVLDATPEELERVAGVGEGISTFFSLRKAVERYYNIKRDEENQRMPLHTPDDFGNALKSRFVHQRNEVVYVLCLDGKCKQLGCLFVGEGSVNSANVPIRRIVELCLNANATSVVLAHNHPGGLAFPSADDVQTTKRLAQALATVDVYLADHLIFTEEDYISMVLSGYYRPSESMLSL